MIHGKYSGQWIRMCAAAVFLAAIAVVACNTRAEERTTVERETAADGAANTETATFGAGCFWCVEAVFSELQGVVTVESGYMGGTVADPTYDQVCSGRTGHAEVCQIRFDPAKARFEELLEVFWKTHDPTTLNRQGNDVGTQYRSAVFYHTPQQKTVARKYKQALNDSGAFPRPIVTEVVPATHFYKAEAYHQDYYRNNSQQAYCQVIIGPKLEKFRKVFADQLKAND